MRSLICAAAGSAAIRIPTPASPGCAPQAQAPRFPNQPGPRSIHSTAHAIDLLDDSEYQRPDSRVEAKKIRKHKPDGVIWRVQGVDVSEITNTGDKLYPTLAIE